MANMESHFGAFSATQLLPSSKDISVSIAGNAAKKTMLSYQDIVHVTKRIKNLNDGDYLSPRI